MTLQNLPKIVLKKSRDVILRSLEKTIVGGAKIYVLKKSGLTKKDLKKGDFEVFKAYEAGVGKHLGVIDNEMICEYKFKGEITEEILNYLIVHGYDVMIPEEKKTKEVVLRMVNLKHASIIPRLKEEFLKDKDVFFTYVMACSGVQNNAKRIWELNYFHVEAQKDIEMINLLASEYNLEVLISLHPELKRDAEFQLALLDSFAQAKNISSIENHKNLKEYLMVWFTRLDETLLNNREFVKKFLFGVEKLLRKDGSDVDIVNLFKIMVGEDLLNDDKYLIEYWSDIKKIIETEECDFLTKYIQNGVNIGGVKSNKLLRLVWGSDIKKISFFNPSYVYINKRMIEAVIEEYELCIKDDLEAQDNTKVNRTVWINSVSFFIYAMVRQKSIGDEILFSKSLLSRMVKNPIILEGVFLGLQKVNEKRGSKIFNVEGLKSFEDVVIYLVEERWKLDINVKKIEETIFFPILNNYCKNDRKGSIKLWKFCLRHKIVSMSKLDVEILNHALLYKWKLVLAKKIGLLSSKSYIENINPENIVDELLNPNLEDKAVLNFLLKKDVLNHEKIKNYDRTTFNGINHLDGVIMRLLNVGLDRNIPSYLWNKPEIIQQVLYRLFYVMESNSWEKSIIVSLDARKKFNKYIPEEYKNGYLYYFYVYVNFNKDKKMIGKYKEYFDSDDMWISVILDENIKGVNFNHLFPKEVLWRPNVKSLILEKMTANDICKRFDDISFLNLEEQRLIVKKVDIDLKIEFVNKSGSLLNKHEEDILQVMDGKGNDITKLILNIDESLMKNDTFVVKLIDRLMEMNYFMQVTSAHSYYSYTKLRLNKEFVLDKFLWNDEIKSQFTKTYGIVAVMEIYKENPYFLRDLVVNSESLKMKKDLELTQSLMGENINLKTMVKF